jgi:3D (Asp-Asp-Asp) domain-containing protein
MLSGERDVNRLTNMIFYARHPHLPAGYRIKRHERALAQAWLRIREDTVKPLLRRLETGTPASSAPPRTSQIDFGNLDAGMTPPAAPGAYRKFRLTTYHDPEQSDYPTGAVRVPIFGDDKSLIAWSSPRFFSKLSLEGKGRLVDGRLVKVTGTKVSVSGDDHAPVLAHHLKAYARSNQRRRAAGRPPVPTTYSGIVVRNGRVVRVSAFHVVPSARMGIGYGVQRQIPYVPFRTLAADIGIERLRRHDRAYVGKGGVVPPGTRVYIKEYDGLRLPDGTTHDGWFVVNDTGGAIFGAHFDVFVGTRDMRRQAKGLPRFGQVWFSGIEERIPPGYTYGLTK